MNEAEAAVLRQAQRALQDLVTACRRVQGRIAESTAQAPRLRGCAEMMNWQLSNASSATYALGALLCRSSAAPATAAPIDWQEVDARLDRAMQFLGWNRAQHEIHAIIRDVARLAAGGGRGGPLDGEQGAPDAS